MKTKDNSVNIYGLKFVMRPALIEADSVWKEAEQELVITSARDGLHWAGSLHYFGYAIDCRINYFDGDWDKAKIFGQRVLPMIQRRLGISFRCLLEKTHIHIEYNIDRR